MNMYSKWVSVRKMYDELGKKFKDEDPFKETKMMDLYNKIGKIEVHREHDKAFGDPSKC